MVELVSDRRPDSGCAPAISPLGSTTAQRWSAVAVSGLAGGAPKTSTTGLSLYALMNVLLGASSGTFVLRGKRVAINISP